MWISISELAASCGGTPSALKPCLREGAASCEFQYAGGFVRAPPLRRGSCRVTTTGLPHQIVLGFCKDLATQEQPWVPVIVVEHVAAARAGISTAQFALIVRGLLKLDWVRLHVPMATSTPLMRAMTRVADAAVAVDIVSSFSA